jgi:hypothetical protein
MRAWSPCSSSDHAGGQGQAHGSSSAAVGRARPSASAVGRDPGLAQRQAGVAAVDACCGRSTCRPAACRPASGAAQQAVEEAAAAQGDTHAVAPRARRRARPAPGPRQRQVKARAPRAGIGLVGQPATRGEVQRSARWQQRRPLFQPVAWRRARARSRPRPLRLPVAQAQQAGRGVEPAAGAAGRRAVQPARSICARPWPACRRPAAPKRGTICRRGPAHAAGPRPCARARARRRRRRAAPAGQVRHAPPGARRAPTALRRPRPAVAAQARRRRAPGRPPASASPARPAHRDVRVVVLHRPPPARPGARPAPAPARVLWKSGCRSCATASSGPTGSSPGRCSEAPAPRRLGCGQVAVQRRPAHLSAVQQAGGVLQEGAARPAHAPGAAGAGSAAVAWSAWSCRWCVVVAGPAAASRARRPCPGRCAPTPAAPRCPG